MKLTVKKVLLFLILISGITYSFIDGGILGAVTGVDQQADVDNEVLEVLEDQEEVSVIVVLKDESTKDPEEKKEMIKKVQEDVLRNLEEKNDNETKTGLKKVVSSILNQDEHDIELNHKFSTVNGFSGEVTKKGLDKLKKDPNVEKVYFNKVRRIFLSESVPLINADDTWEINIGGYDITGEGQTVCVVDTGVDYTHPALGGCSTSSFLDGSCPKVVAGYDFVNDDGDPIDDYGHGTHVSGIIASTDDTYKGVAPDAKIVAMKVCNSGGSCTDADVIAGLEWCVNNASKYNISVISISLGGGQYDSYCDGVDSLTSIVNEAVSNNLSFVAATGNSGSGNISAPACIQNATRVTATTKSDTFPSYASRHSFFNDTIAATGHSIRSLALGGGTKTLSGTSMSTPHVSGSIALMKQYLSMTCNDVLTPEQIEQRIISTGKQVYDSSSDSNYSRVDALAMLQPVISYVATPEDGSVFTNNSIELIISSGTDLTSTILELTFPNGSIVNLTMSGESTQFSYNLSDLKEGLYSYRVFGTDATDFVGTRCLQSFSVDFFNPLVFITSPVNNSRLNSSNNAFNATIHESNINSVIFNFDNSTGKNFNLTPTNNSGNWNLNLNSSALTNGNHVMTVMATDLAGNVNGSQQVHFTVDHTAPNVNFLSPQDKSNYTVSSGNEIFNVSVNDSLSSISSVFFQFDNSSGNNFNITAFYSNSSNTWSAVYNVSSLMDGLHSVAVFAEDEHGNVNDSVSTQFTVDNTAPSVTLISPLSGSIFTSTSNDQIFNVSVNDSSSSINSVIFQFDNSSGNNFNVTAIKSNSSNTWSAVYNVSSLMDGLHAVAILAEDYLGNRNDSISLNFTVDKTSPSVTLSSPDNNLETSNNTVTFSCSAEDNSGLSNLTLYGNWNGWHANQTITLTGTSNSTSFVATLPDGNHLWNCLATDTESYSGFSSQNRSVLIDSTIPLISNVSLGSLTENSTEVTWDTDEDSNSSINYGSTLNLGTISSENVFQNSHSFSLINLDNSTTYYFNVTSCDSLGNCNTLGSYNFTTNETSAVNNSDENNTDNSTDDSSDSGNDDSGSSGSSGGSSGGGGGGSSAGSSGSSGTSIASEVVEELETPGQIIEETSPVQEVQELQDELEQELSAPDETKEVVTEPESRFGSMITGFFSALVPSDSKTGLYVISSVVGLAILISVVLLLIHRRGKKDPFADDDEEEEIDISYHERLP